MPTSTMRRIVVVGASLAGLRAVQTLRKEGFDGDLTLVGAEPHRPYDRPPLSKQLLAGRWDVDRVELLGEADSEALGLDLRLGRRAVGLDLSRRAVSLDDGVSVAFDGLVIATGASPRMLPGSRPVGGVLTLRTIEDCLALSSALERPGVRVVVVGAGFIGSEVAATASGRGARVTVVEALPVPLARVLGARIGGACAALHENNGVEVRCGVGVAAIEGGERVRRVVLSDGSAVAADVVVVGIGVQPATGWLERSGLELADGVMCDARCFAAPGVAAAGDVARWHHARLGLDLRLEHWTNAAEQGRVAARNLLVGPVEAEPYTPLPYFWSDQYDLRIQYAGHARPDDEVIVKGSVEERSFVAVYGRGERFSAVLAFGRLRDFMAHRRLLAKGASFGEAAALDLR